jgi:hypothetical protein
MSRPFFGTASNNLSFKLSTSNDIALSAPNLDLGASSSRAELVFGVLGVVNPESAAAWGDILEW